MINSKVFVLMCSFIFLMSFSLAVPPVTTVFTGDVGINIETQFMSVYKYGEARFSTIYLSNSSTGHAMNITTNPSIECYVYLRDSQGFEVMILEADPHLDHWDLNGSSGGLTPIGSYAWTVRCEDYDAEVGGTVGGYFDITESGVELNAQSIFANFIFLLFFCGLLISLYKYKSTVNLEQQYDKVLTKYKNNQFKGVLGGIWHEFMRDTFIMVYLISWLIGIVLLDVAFNFGMSTIYTYFSVIMNVMSVGFVLIGIVFLARMAEILFKLKDDFDDDSWGIVK